jgi:hypothetical protein
MFLYISVNARPPRHSKAGIDAVHQITLSAHALLVRRNGERPRREDHEAMQA